MALVTLFILFAPAVKMALMTLFILLRINMINLGGAYILSALRLSLFSFFVATQASKHKKFRTSSLNIFKSF